MNCIPKNENIKEVQSKLLNSRISFLKLEMALIKELRESEEFKSDDECLLYLLNCQNSIKLEIGNVEKYLEDLTKEYDADDNEQQGE
ncbi:hypothetical protein [Dipodfec virus UOA04_Rod_753]|nr:hypothetical protein [Dipodfec virus UOA04_Rod_753]